MQDKNTTYEVEITGCVYSNDINLTADEFLDKFITFIEDNNWYFGGGTRQIIDGHYVDAKLKAVKPVNNK